MRKIAPTLVLAALVATACARNTQVESAGDVAVTPSVTPTDSRTIPSGTTLQVRLNENIGTKTNKVGDTFSATVVNAVTASNGATVVPAGATVQGKITGLDDSDHAGEPAAIRLDFETLDINGTKYPFEAAITATELKTTGQDTREETLKKAGVGAAAGAVLGAIIGEGDLKKILLGGAIGAAAGTVISLGTGDVEAVLPSGSTMTIRSTEAVALR